MLSLPNLTSIGGDYGVKVEAQGSVSTIDLPDLTSFSPTDSGYSALSVTDDGTVVLAAGLTSLNGVTIVLDGTGTLSNGTNSSATTQFISITDGAITVEAGDYTSAFPNLADIDGSSLRVYGGGSLILPAVTTYTNGNGYEYFQAAQYAYYTYVSGTYYGSGSVGVLSLPALTYDLRRRHRRRGRGDGERDRPAGTHLAYQHLLRITEPHGERDHQRRGPEDLERREGRAGWHGCDGREPVDVLHERYPRDREWRLRAFLRCRRLRQ